MKAQWVAYSEPVATLNPLIEFPLKPIVAAVFLIAMGVLVSGCAGTGSAGNPLSSANPSGASSEGSGITVFGTIDAGVSVGKNSSSR